MTTNNDFNSLLTQLEQLEKSKDYLSIGNTLDRRFDSKINDIIGKWTSNETLVNEERKFLDLYSNLQLTFVEYCLFDYTITINDENIIELFRKCLFRAKQIDGLKQAVIFIRDEQQTNDTESEDDEILLYLMRMIDARTLAYRLCYKDLNPPPTNLNDELILCLNDRHAKNYLYNIKSLDETDDTTLINRKLNYRHQFFAGCCTFAVALFEENKGILKDKDHTKYICLLAKYVRVVLRKNHFEEYQSMLYCLRGILAILTNCVPTENWINIINTALANEEDDNAQQANPFNTDLFVLIISRLLASNILREKTIQYGSSDATLLVDIALIFLNKWSDTPRDLGDDDDADETNNESLLSDEPNQVFRLLRSNTELGEKLGSSRVIIPYIDAKYDRLRLMALSTLSNIMSFKDFEDLQKKKPTMAQDLVELIFDFINRAVAQSTRKYKGISFERLLRYLLRFLVQDVVKKQTITYISKIVDYAKDRQLYALKILRRISSSPEMKQDLINDLQLKEFLENEANILFDSNPRMKKIIDQIRRNLAPEQPKELSNINDGSRQAFISYCHRDKDICDRFVRALEHAELFTNIWLDKYHMKDDMVDTITSAIRQSKVIFILLSDAYCLSDFCRREWAFARDKQIKVYHVFVQEDFKRGTYDWVAFNISNDLYYKIYQNDDLQRLINNIRKDNKDQPLLQQRTETLNNSNTSSRLTLDSLRLGTNEYSKKQSVSDWTCEDVQDWCHDKNLNKWCAPLANYHGDALLELRRILSNDSHMTHVLNVHSLTVFDVALFKCELDKLSSKRIIPHKKVVLNRRSSKSSAK
jgi:hypothetical protein